MERNKLNTRLMIKAIINKYGSKAGAAAACGCTESYIRSMESGTNIPGKFLFEKITVLAED